MAAKTVRAITRSGVSKAVPPVSFRPTAPTTSRPIVAGTIHRPRPRPMASLGPRLWPLGRPAACQGSLQRLGAERLAARRRLRRFALEALATAMATTAGG